MSCNCSNCNKSCKSCQNCGGCSSNCSGVEGGCDLGCDDDTDEEGVSEEDLKTKNNKGPVDRQHFAPVRAEVTKVLTLTHWLDSKLFSPVTANRLSITGQRMDPNGELQGANSFLAKRKISNLVPGNGPVAITTLVRDITPGFWKISASLVGGPELSSWSGSISGPNKIIKPGNLKTKLGAARFTRTVIPGLASSGWLSFVILGGFFGFIMQIMGMIERHVAIVPSLIISFIAIGFGILTAKAWFVVQFKRPWRLFFSSGICIQGFLAGWVAAAVSSLLIIHTPIGNFLDVSAPGLFVAMASGRIGCFFAGCCAGIPTNSRWGVWSSDGNLGTRRIPTQLMESVTCLVIGLAAFLFLRSIIFPGAVFLTSWVTYTVIRGALLLPLRYENIKHHQPLTN